MLSLLVSNKRTILSMVVYDVCTVLLSMVVYDTSPNLSAALVWS